MSILGLFELVATLLFAAIIARVAGAFVPTRELDQEEDPARIPAKRATHSHSGRRWPIRLAMLAVAAALVYLQFGGSYFFVDPDGTQWSLSAHGWPLVHEYTLGEALTSGVPNVPLYLACISVDLIVTLAIVAATKLVLRGWLAKQPLWRPGRSALIEPIGLAAAGLVLLGMERWFSRRVQMPGADNVIIYTTLVYELWYIRVVVLFGLACLLYTAGRGLVRGYAWFSRLRAEGVI